MIIMKKLTSLLIGCSLALAGAALAQQPVEQQSPSKDKHPPEKAHATHGQPGANAAKPQERPATHQGATQQHGTAHDAGAMKQQGATHDRELRMSMPRISLTRKRAKKLTRATNLQTLQKRTSPVNRPMKRRMSPVLEKARRIVRTRNQGMLPRRERMFPVMRRECRRRRGRSSRFRSGSKVKV